MSYTLTITAHARRQFKKLQKPLQKRIRRALDDLAEEPMSSMLDVKKLSDRDGYRLRVGDYRIIYTIDAGKVTIYVIEIGHRREVY